MKRFSFFVIFLLALMLLLAACQPVEPLTPAAEDVLEKETEISPTEAPTVDNVVALELVGPSESVSLTMSELMALPVSEGA